MTRAKRVEGGRAALARTLVGLLRSGKPKTFQDLQREMSRIYGQDLTRAQVGGAIGYARHEMFLPITTDHRAEYSAYRLVNGGTPEEALAMNDHVAKRAVGWTTEISVLATGVQTTYESAQRIQNEELIRKLHPLLLGLQETFWAARNVAPADRHDVIDAKVDRLGWNVPESSRV